MTIETANIKWLESERMSDTTDGGGRRTARVIVDGQPGNIFPKVSRLDGVYGRVNLRKIFGHVDTPGLDTYAGAHAVILDAPDNDRIKVNLFATGSDFDTRTAARDRIESYVIAGPETRMVLYGRQLMGQQAITVLQRVEDPLPEVGVVLCLSKETAGVVESQQFVRVEDVAHEVRIFTDNNGDFSRRIVTLKLSGKLLSEYVGWETVSRISSTARGSLVRGTTVADAARYFGISKLAQPAAKDDLTLRVDSIFSSIVPTNQREAAIANASLGGSRPSIPTVATATGFHDITGAMPGGTFTTEVNLGRGVVPGSLQIRVGTFTSRIYAPTLTDDGLGGIPDQEPMPGYGFHISGGTIDYDTGAMSVTWHGIGQGDMVLNASYTPGVSASQASHVHELPVTLATRGTVQALLLDPLPALGTVVVDYRALGKWYRLRDDGTGELGGDDAAYGTGTVDPVTGNLVATLGALPDVGSSVIVSWGSPAHYQVRAAATSMVDGFARISFALAALPVKAATLVVKYTAGAIEYTANADANGNITGGGITGTVDHTTGTVELRFATRAPNVGSEISASYTQSLPSDALAPLSRTGDGTVTANDPAFATVPNVAAKGLRLRVPVAFPAMNGSLGTTVYMAAVDDGAGNIVTLPATGSDQDVGYSHAGGAIIGSLDYESGSIAIDLAAAIAVQRMTWMRQLNGGGFWSAVTYNMSLSTGFYHWTVRTANASTDAAVTASIPVLDAPLTLDLLNASTDSIVPGSLKFTAFGTTYRDVNGTLFDAQDVASGTLDYATGQASLTAYVNNVALNASVAALLSKHGSFTVASATFRTSGSPLRPASTFVQVTADDGTTLTATCDQDGAIAGAFARGTINQQFGIVHIEWGSMVPAAGNENEPWYDPANVDGADVWKPREVMPETIRYSTVVLSSLPVDANILGLDPVRLPSDGRVPIIRPGDVVVIHHTAIDALPNPPGAGVTYALGRGDLADLVLVDAAGARVPATQYIADLAAGTVTMAADMNLIGLQLPLSAKHRIEELNLASDAQINGEISLSGPLSRDFPDGSMVSSALLFGDLVARVTNVFDQKTWTNVWQGSRIGDDTPANYDTINFPIEVSNDAAVTERWRLNFTTATAFQVIGENLGVIATGSTAADCAPANPLTGKPYFTIRQGGWGAGWGIGNQLRLDTIGATAATWTVRTVLPGATLAGDAFDVQLRGDVDA